MTNYKYLIIGGGMTAAAAVDGIREVDSTGGIGLISAEPDPPYNRPPLSKALWKGKPLDTIWRKTEDKTVTVHLGRVVKEIVAGAETSCGRQGRRLHLRKTLVGHGRQPRRLAVRRRPDHLLSHAGGLSATSSTDRKGPTVCRDRWRVYRLRNRSGLDPERERSGDDFPRQEHRRPRLSARPLSVRVQLL